MKKVIDALMQWGYEIIGSCGEGAFSQVYRVKEVASGSIFACKVSRELNMLRVESEILRKISHPLFPKFRDFRQWNEDAFLFMEYVQGVSLMELVTKGGALPERWAIQIAVPLAEGLEYLHELNPPILFRDLKPDNIMLREDGEVKLLDLGSAGLQGGSKHVITGTPGFAAPEQWEKDGKEGFYSDVYGLARIMCFMLTAPKAAYTEWGTQKVRFAGAQVHHGVVRLLEQCLRRETGERIPDMRYFLQKLEPYYTMRKREILKAEIAACFPIKKDAEYIFQKNIFLS